MVRKHLQIGAGGSGQDFTKETSQENPTGGCFKQDTDTTCIWEETQDVKSNSSKWQFKKIQSQIKESCIQDFHDWVDNCVKEMEVANDK